LTELSSQYSVHPEQIRRWRKVLTEGITGLFESKENGKERADKNKLIDELYKQIGQLKVELDWLKKKTGINY